MGSTAGVSLRTGVTLHLDRFRMRPGIDEANILRHF